MLILVLETSTTSSKAMLYDSRSNKFDIISRPFPNSINTTIKHDADGVFRHTLETGSILAKGKNIDIISLCGTWHGILVCDKENNPITETYTWAHTGAAAIADNIRKNEELKKQLYSRTGCMVHATYPLYKLMYLKEKGIDISNSYLFGQGTYNFYKMTGKRKVTTSMASGSGLLNISKLEYDELALDLAGIGKEQLGQLCTYRDVEPLNKECANILGVKSGIPVIPVNPDGALNQVGAGALEKGVMTLSVGTSAAIRLSVDKPTLAQDGGTWCYVSPDSWLSGAATAGACNCVDWFKNSVFGKEVSYSSLEKLEVRKEKVPTFLPFLYGERCPGWRDDKRAGFFGVNPSSTGAEMYYAVLEGVLYNIYQCYKTLTSLNGEPKTIKVSGGILNSKAWTQMCSDIFQKDIEISKSEQASVLGGAALGLEILGEIDSIKSFSQDKGTIITPRREYASEYEKKFQQYEYWYNKTN